MRIVPLFTEVQPEAGQKLNFAPPKNIITTSTPSFGMAPIICTYVAQKWGSKFPAPTNKPGLSLVNGDPDNAVAKFCKTRHTVDVVTGGGNEEGSNGKAAAAAEATCAVFNTVELAENILSNLGCRDIARTMSVCHRFKEIIDGSPTLQEALFARPAEVSHPDRIVDTVSGTISIGAARDIATTSKRQHKTAFWVQTCSIVGAPNHQPNTRLAGYRAQINDQVFTFNEDYLDRPRVVLTRRDPRHASTMHAVGTHIDSSKCVACGLLKKVLGSTVVLSLRPPFHAPSGPKPFSCWSDTSPALQ